MNESPLPELVVPDAYPFEETDDLFSGPDLHPDLLGLLPYVGLWRGIGRGGYPGIEDFDYAQEIRFSHDGRPFLSYEARAWLVDADLAPIRPAWRESGWWRPGPTNDKKRADEVEVLLTYPTGITELYLGKVDGLKVEMVTDVVARTQTAKEVTAGHRLYGIVDDTLLYAVDMAAMGHPLTSHLSARLRRIRSTSAPDPSVLGRHEKDA